MEAGSREGERPAMPVEGTRGAERPQGPPAVEVSGVTKSFNIPDHRYTTLKERILRPRGRTAHSFEAVKDVSFEVGRGEFFGVLGRNGSGKSTLLKMIAGIMPADSGTIETRGTIAPMLALGLGFHPELAARDNVIINGSLHGVGRKEMQRRFPSILEYAELEEFEELPLKNYSSGMMLRLAFAAGIHVDAEILLLDEILVVGDLKFQEKCFDTFRTLQREGKTIILVTHALGIITQFCDRAMLMDRGAMISLGDPEKVVNEYTTTALEEIVATGAASAERWGDDTAEIAGVWLEDADGNETKRFRRGDEVTIKVKARFHTDLEEVHLGFSVRDQANQLLFDLAEPVNEGTVSAKGSDAVLRASFEAWLNPGLYSIWPIVARIEDIPHISDLRANYGSFMIEGDSRGVGPMHPRTRTDVEVG